LLDRLGETVSVHPHHRPYHPCYPPRPAEEVASEWLGVIYDRVPYEYSSSKA